MSRPPLSEKMKKEKKTGGENKIMREAHVKGKTHGGRGCRRGFTWAAAPGIMDPWAETPDAPG